MNPEKNLALEAERGLTFERIVVANGEGRCFLKTASRTRCW